MAGVISSHGFITTLALPVAAPLVTAAIVGVAKGEIYGAARATPDPVDHKKRGQSIGSPVQEPSSNWRFIATGLHAAKSALTGLQPSAVTFWNWTPLTTSLHGVMSAVKGVQSSIRLPTSATVGVACRGTNSVRVSISTQETLMNVMGKGIFHQDITSYVVLFCLTARDGKYVLDFLCSNEQQVLALKNKLLATVPCYDNQIQPELLALSILNNSSKYLFSIPCPVENFIKIKYYVQECINSTLTGNLFGLITRDMKVIVEFFTKYDLTWALEVTHKIVRQMNCPKVETFCGVLSGFYDFNQNIIKKALSNETFPFSSLKFTPGDVIQIVKLCINEQQNFYTKFEKLCRDYILPGVGHYASSTLTHVVRRCIKSPNTIDTALTDEEIFYAASQEVGSELSGRNAIVARVNSDVFVIITDRNIQVDMLQIVVDKENGTLHAVAARQNCANISDTYYKQLNNIQV